MSTLNHLANTTNSGRRASPYLGFALALIAVGVQAATAAESTVRFLAMKEKVQTRESKDARLTGVAPVDSKTTTLPPADNITPIPADSEPAEVAQEPGEFAKAIREAVALRDAINVPAVPTVPAEAVAVQESNAASNTKTHPPVEAPPCSCDASPPCATSATSEIILSGPFGCPYCPNQSGAHFVCGVECGPGGAPCYATWHDARYIPWSLFGPGEYVGSARTEHVSTYYLRVNDLITLTYITSRRKMGERYRLGVGDRLRIESSLDESLDREVTVQPDGEITLPLVGEVMAAGKTVQELREDLVEVFREAQRQPQITVTPLEINTGLQEIVRAVKSEIGSTGQAQDLKVTPEGTIQAPGLGSVYVQGLTLDELRAELEARYAAMYGAGLLVSPALTERATSYVFVGGEVNTPGRYTLEGPTTVMQAIALAGGWNNGGNIHQVVVFRRDENWCLKATKIDVHKPLYGKDPCPVNDVWLRDNDLVVVPKTKILCAADVIELYFTRGVYAVFPVTFFQDLSKGSTVAPVP